jgi:hypothetical protein
VFRRLPILCAVVVCVLWAVESPAATLRVCSSGCQFSGLQPALDAAAPGDTILLAAGQTFVGPFILRAKPGGSAWITIRSDAPDSLLPADGVRLVPMGRPGGNTPRELLPRLIGQSGPHVTTPVLRTDPGAHHYVLKFLEVDGSANLGFETLIAIGENSTAPVAYDFVIDRVYAHGHPSKGQKRGLALNSIRTDILNSYFCDFMSVNSDSQAIAGFNGAGPFRIANNFLEAAGENIMFGGADPMIANLVPADIEIVRNHLYKPLAWRNPILSPPASPRATAAGGGALAAATHYFKVVAIKTTHTSTAVSLPSASVALTTGSSGSAVVSWSAVTGADRYRIYRGTSANGQSVYLETPSAATSFTYTGASERSGTPPSQGTFWTVKNLFELKNAERVRIDGNLIENIWAAGQFGYALVLTPRNQDGASPWSRVRDVTITNNVIRHASGVLHLSGYDYPNTSQQTQRITLRNNLMEDIDGSKWGGYTKVFLVGDGAAGLVIDRNTILHGNSSVLYAYGTRQMTGLVYTNNLAEHRDYGIMGDSAQPGNYTITTFFPGATVSYNVLAGGPAASYPATNTFPTLAVWTASFADLAGGDYRLLTTSPFFSAGAGGSTPGVDLGVLAASTAGADGPPTTPPPAAPTGVRVKTN